MILELCVWNFPKAKNDSRCHTNNQNLVAYSCTSPFAQRFTHVRNVRSKSLRNFPNCL